VNHKTKAEPWFFAFHIHAYMALKNDFMQQHEKLAIEWFGS